MVIKAISFTLFAVWFGYMYTTRDTATFDSDDVKGKNVLVTGASAGIGRETVLYLCELGANVVITARREGKLKEVAEACEKKGAPGKIMGYITADMGNVNDVKTVVSKAMTYIESLDYLIINHALSDGGQYGFLDRKLKDIDSIRHEYEVNFFSYVQLTSDAMPHLLTSQGRVGIISSVVGRHPMLNLGITTSSKHAINGFYDTLNLESYMKETNVSFTVVMPGPVMTSAFDAAPASFQQEGVDLAKWATDYSAPQTPRAVAEDAVQATAMRRVEVYSPNTWAAWGKVLMRNIYPNMFRDNVRNFRLKN